MGQLRKNRRFSLKTSNGDTSRAHRLKWSAERLGFGTYVV